MTDFTHEHPTEAPAEQGPHRKGVSRRKLLAGGAGAAGAWFLAHATGDFSLVSQAAAEGRGSPRRGNGRYVAQDPDEFDDADIDPAEALATWFPSRYGEGDELGTLNEITPHKTMDAMHSIKHNPAMPPKIYNLGEILDAEGPAFGERFYAQQLQLPGAPSPPNALVGMEERFQTTYHIATQIDGLPHIGIDNVFYNGFTTEQLIEGQAPGEEFGVNFLGQEKVPPFITRGVLLDVLGVKLEQGDEDALSSTNDGEPLLADEYRITLEDLLAAMEFSGVDSIEPGDVVLIHTGWSKLYRSDPSRYIGQDSTPPFGHEPGIYLREARWLAQFRPAVVGSDTWALEVLPPVTNQVFPVHQEFLTHHGIRIGEAMNTEEMVEDGVGEFVFFYTGQRPRGGTAANVAPGAIAQKIGRGGGPGRGRGRGRRR